MHAMQSRKDSHIKTFENQALALRRELEELINKGDSEFCCEVPSKPKTSKATQSQSQAEGAMTQQDVVNLVVREFERVLQSHRERDAKWYNDGTRHAPCVLSCLVLSSVVPAEPLVACR